MFHHITIFLLFELVILFRGHQQLYTSQLVAGQRENVRFVHRCISQRTVNKMADFEILTLCVSLTSSKMCTSFCKELVTRYCLYLVKRSIPSRHVSKFDFITHNWLLYD